MKTAKHKALFYNIPGHGHVNPSLPLVAELTRRGHEVIYFATPSYRAAIEAAGADFRDTTGMPDDYFGGPKMDGSSPMYAALSLWTTTEQILPGLVAEAQAENPDYILFDQMCPWGYFIAGILGVPGIASHSLMPLGPPTFSALRNPYLRKPLLAVLRQDPLHGFRAYRIIRRMCRQYGVTTPSFDQLLSLTGDLSLAYTIAEIPPKMGSLHPTVRFMGRTRPEDPPADPALFAPANGRPLVYVSLGSLINRNHDFYANCIEAFTGQDVYVLVTTGRGVDPAALGPLPENVAVHNWLPQSAVLKRAALFISHGGLNSLHDAFLFGVPLLVIPQQDEQAINGWRAVDLGAGMMLSGDQVNAATMRSHTLQILQDHTFRDVSAQLGEKLQAAGGALSAADEIETLLKKSAATSPASRAHL